MFTGWLASATVVAFSFAHARSALSTKIEVTTDIGRPLHPGCEFPADAMKLYVQDGTKILADFDFCSSYGVAKAKVVADSLGQHYVALEQGEGHGTNAVTTYLSVYELGPDLMELIRIPISWSVGPTQRFSYSYQIKTRNTGLQIDLVGADVAGAECCVPKEKTRSIELGAKR